MPEISVIVPVYKVEEYLKECINSILGQSYIDIEVILVDDGSPDNCGVICDNYLALDKRVTVIHKENGGLSSARNAGLDIATGNFITFVDSDDIISSYYLEYLYQKALKYKADISICGHKIFEDREGYKNEELEGYEDKKDVILSGKDAVLSVYSNVAGRIPVTAWAKLYRKELFNSVRFPVGKQHEDDATVPIILQKSKTVIWSNIPLYGYRNRTGSIMREAFSIKRYDAIEAINRCIDYFYLVHDNELAEAAHNNKEALIAIYSLLSRKEGIYKEIPKEYRMSKCRAIQKMRKILPYDSYSYRLAWVYPRYVVFEAKIRNIFRKIGFKNER